MTLATPNHPVEQMAHPTGFLVYTCLIEGGPLLTGSVRPVRRVVSQTKALYTWEGACWWEEKQREVCPDKDIDYEYYA